MAFKNFNIRRSKVARALYWLKKNNCYYVNIVIDEEILQSLPENGSISDQLRHLKDEEYQYDDDDDVSEDIIGNNFVSAPLLSSNEERAIGDTLGQMQANDDLIMWPNIDGNPINEFQSPGYIARAFLTLYPTGKADLCSDHIWDVKPAEYFSHLLKYKDGRFAHHPCWWYFALNSQIQWRALQEGKVYVKQNLNDKQYTVKEV